MIGDRDLESIGAHCHYDYCNQLDFLPFRCESCKYTYCLDHRTESAHKCSKMGAWAAARRAASNNGPSSMLNPGSAAGKPTLENAKQCSHPKCKTFINTLGSVGVPCTTCNRQYCLKHRLREEHDCSNLAPLGARPASAAATQAQKAQAALARLRLWGKEKAAAAAQSSTSTTSSFFKSKNSASSQRAAAAAALATLKKTAKPPMGVAPSALQPAARVYLSVEAESTTTTTTLKTPPQGSFYYNKEWSVGRMLDDAARQLQVQNVNNRGGGEEEKLRVFWIEGGRILGFGEKLKECGMVDGHTAVLLRGIGAPESEGAKA
jgi:hypothetical protein